MKENKFRAWNSKEKFMDSAWLIDWEHGSVCHGKHNQSELDDCTLMQYTGVKDKNGREIYEGDIVEQLSERTYESVKGTVKFFDGSYLIEFLSGDNGVFLFDEVAYNEVLGNVYENPELLEELQNGSK